MMRTTSLLLVLLGASPAGAEEIPRYDIEASCRAAPTLGPGTQNTDRNCVRDETQARAQLGRQWSDFDAQRRYECAQEASIGGPPSYVALLTCLQM